ncbi:MAG: DUF2442 domain-containing protein [Oscillospiraceae bacterium]|nr:DUF2442 domain-containing protein [Oscillospiraceae bacterium]
MDANIPREVFDYFKSGRRKILSVAANDNFTLTIVFDNNERKIYDMRENLKGDVFRHFRALPEFKRVYVDNNGCIAWDIDSGIDSNVVWRNKVDLCPDSCYIDSILAD